MPAYPAPASESTIACAAPGCAARARCSPTSPRRAWSPARSPRNESQLVGRRCRDREHRGAHRPVGAGQVRGRRALDHRRHRLGGRINQRMPPERFEMLKARVKAYLQGQELFVQDLFAGADPAHRVRVRLVTTTAWHALFARNMFIRPSETETAGVRARLRHPARSRTSRPIRRSTGCAPPPPSRCRSSRRSSSSPAPSMPARSRNRSLPIMNWKLPAAGVMPMHCSGQHRR